MKKSVNFLVLFLAFVAFSQIAAQDKKDKKDKKEEKFEKTGTSADAFLESAFNLGQDMKKLTTAMQTLKLMCTCSWFSRKP
jgi:hypothetical protein